MLGFGQLESSEGTARFTSVKPRYSVAKMITESAGFAVRGALDPHYGRIDGDRDRDGLPDYLNAMRRPATPTTTGSRTT